MTYEGAGIELDERILSKRILDIVLEQCKADGCIGCAYINTEEWEEPCRRCARNCKDYWGVGEQE